MKLIVCVDDRGGVMYNKRRQSRDSVQRADMLAITADSRLLVTPYSAKLISADNVTVAPDPLAMAESGDYCFIEDVDPTPYADSVDTVIKYLWNTAYPYDTRFDLDMSDYKLVSSVTFIGTSHKKITREIYKK